METKCVNLKEEKCVALNDEAAITYKRNQQCGTKACAFYKDERTDKLQKQKCAKRLAEMRAE